MAPIQILELPTDVVGDDVTTPFAIVIDEVTTDTVSTSTGVEFRTNAELSQTEADAIACRVGAVGAILVSCSLNVT